MTTPTTPYEWQNAMDLAHGALVLESVRQYGLVTGGPAVNVERCQEIYHQAKDRGHRPSANSIDMFVAACQSGYGRSGAESLPAARSKRAASHTEAGKPAREKKSVKERA